MSGQFVPPLLRLAPEEAGANLLLSRFAATHPGVTIVRPHHDGEPWRAEIREGAVPGGGGTTSAVRGADRPSGLLAKLEAMFAGRDPEDEPG